MGIYNGTNKVSGGATDVRPAQYLADADRIISVGEGGSLVTDDGTFINLNGEAINVTYSATNSQYSFAKASAPSTSLTGAAAVLFTEARGFLSSGGTGGLQQSDVSQVPGTSLTIGTETFTPAGGGVSGTAGTIPVFEDGGDGVGDSPITSAVGSTASVSTEFNTASFNGDSAGTTVFVSVDALTEGNGNADTDAANLQAVLDAGGTASFVITGFPQVYAITEFAPSNTVVFNIRTFSPGLTQALNSDDAIVITTVASTTTASSTTVTGDLTVTGTIGNPAASGSASFFVEDTGATSAAGAFQFTIADSADTGAAGFITFVRE